MLICLVIFSVESCFKTPCFHSYMQFSLVICNNKDISSHKACEELSTIKPEHLRIIENGVAYAPLISCTISFRNIPL